MSGEDRSMEALEAGLQEALLVWKKRPELLCRDCGQMGYSPQHVIERKPGVWEVDRENRLPKGWLSITDTVPEPDGRMSKQTQTLLCPKCREKRSL